MAKLFDADALLQAMKKADEADPDLATCWSRGSIRRIIKRLPPVDAVEVVRCKHCKHFDMRTRECQNEYVSTDNEGGADYYLNFDLDDFCSYGERRDGDG